MFTDFGIYFVVLGEWNLSVNEFRLSFMFNEQD